MIYYIVGLRDDKGACEIGVFETFEQARRAACAVGAVGEPRRSDEGDYLYDGAGHEGDGAYEVWVAVTGGAAEAGRARPRAVAQKTRDLTVAVAGEHSRQRARRLGIALLPRLLQRQRFVVRHRQQ